MGRLACLAAVIGMLADGGLRAQEVILPAEATPPADVAAEMVMDEPRFGLVRWGPFHIIPRARGSAYYDSNVLNRAVDKESDFVVAISPGVTALAQDVADGVGKVLSLDYSPTVLFYTQGSRGDEVTHHGHLRGSLLFPKLSLGLSQRFLFISDPDVDVSTRAKRQVYRTALTSRYAIGEKTSMEVNLSLDLTDYQEDTLLDSWQVANQNWFNYVYSPKLTLGAGFTFGYLEIEEVPNQTFEQIFLRAIYAVAEKVTVSLTGGGELRQYRGGVGDRVSPVWIATAEYRPRFGTVVAVEAYQQFRNSAALRGEDLLRTGGTVTLRQRIYRRLGSTVSGTYYHSDYRATVAGIVATRKDDSFVARVGLDTRLGERWRAEVFYDYLNNQSTIDRYDYDRHRVGARVAWSY
jgi:hypothetical protein